jgi:hypothetical protein
MTRSLYRLLLWLHPPAFRQQFAEEMLWIFDEESKQGLARLFADGIASLMRQWMLRSGLWKLAVAGVCAVLTLWGGLALQPLLLRGLGALRLDSPQGFYVLAAASTVLAISFTLILCVLWFRFSRRHGA